MEKWVKLSENKIKREDKHSLNIPIFTAFKLINGEIYGKLEGYKIVPEHVRLSHYQH